MTDDLVTVQDCIDAGIVLGLSINATLEATRALGFRVRTQDFYDRFREREKVRVRIVKANQGRWLIL